jgi:acetyl esterase/lipase
MRNTRWRIALAVIGCAGALVAGAAEPAAKKAPKAVRERYVDSLIPALKPDRVVVYKRIGGRELALHVFAARGAAAGERRPAFVTIHGGGWSGGDVTRMYPVAGRFAAQGMVGISVQYRLLKPADGVTVFDAVADARSAVRYVRAQAAELGVDPARVVVNGASAGGHLAVATALFSQFDTAGEDAGGSAVPDALVLFYPVIDTSQEGYGQEKIGERWRELSPAHHVRRGLPPTITFHGTGDTTTPFKGAESFHAAMLAAGNRSVLDVHPGGIHGYILYEKPLYEETLVKIERFLRDVRMWPKS